MSDLVQVVAVSLKTHKVLWVMNDKTPDNAEACVSMAVYRQGVEDRFFTTAPNSTYAAGAKFKTCDECEAAFPSTPHVETR